MSDIKSLELDYFYGMQAEMFSFLRIPKFLIKDGRFEKMSNEAKMLFGLLLDRMSLSMKNQWFDDENRVYIIYTVDEIMIDLCIGTQKCVKLLKELVNFGLIERKKQGFSKPDVIYVKNFASLANDGMELPKESEAKVRSRREKKVKEGDVDSVDNVDNSTVFRKSKHEDFENQNTRVLKIETREFPKSKHEDFENQNTGILKIKTREFPKSKPNNTNINNTNNSNTDISYTDHQYQHQYQNIQEENTDTDADAEQTKPVEENIEKYPMASLYRFYEIDYLKEMISSGGFKDEPVSVSDVDNVMDIIYDVLNGTSKTIWLKNEEKPREIVKSRLLKLNKYNLFYAIRQYNTTEEKIRRPKQYMLSILYEAKAQHMLEGNNSLAHDFSHGRYFGKEPGYGNE